MVSASEMCPAILSFVVGLEELRGSRTEVVPIDGSHAGLDPLTRWWEQAHSGSPAHAGIGAPLMTRPNRTRGLTVVRPFIADRLSF